MRNNLYFGLQILILTAVGLQIRLNVKSVGDKEKKTNDGLSKLYELSSIPTVCFFKDNFDNFDNFLKAEGPKSGTGRKKSVSFLKKGVSFLKKVVTKFLVRKTYH